MSMIAFDKVSKRFGSKELYKDFSMEVAENEKVLLMAPSGSGKSTLAKMLMGFEKPDSGSVFVRGLPVDKHNLKEIRKSISYVSQDSDLPNEKLSVLIDSIFSYKANQHLVLDKDYLLQCMERVKLEQRLLDEPISALSGGERQRFALVLALLLERPIMVLDEVTSGLDEDLRQIIIPCVLEMDKTVLVISHDHLWRHHEGIREVALS